jgi:hypothetical protein
LGRNPLHLQQVKDRRRVATYGLGIGRRKIEMDLGPAAYQCRWHLRGVQLVTDLDGQLGSLELHSDADLVDHEIRRSEPGVQMVAVAAKRGRELLGLVKLTSDRGAVTLPGSHDRSEQDEGASGGQARRVSSLTVLGELVNGNGDDLCRAVETVGKVQQRAGDLVCRNSADHRGLGGRRQGRRPIGGDPRQLAISKLGCQLRGSEVGDGQHPIRLLLGGTRAVANEVFTGRDDSW